MSQVSINWVRQQPKAQMIPILGARTAKQLKDNMGLLDWKLTDEQWKRLDDVSKIDLGFPHGFLDHNRYIYGATLDLIDNHRS
jgi:diketogulonate reductase-like aldo/keto reductase